MEIKEKPNLVETYLVPKAGVRMLLQKREELSRLDETDLEIILWLGARDTDSKKSKEMIARLMGESELTKMRFDIPFKKLEIIGLLEEQKTDQVWNRGYTLTEEGKKIYNIVKEGIESYINLLENL